MAVITGVLKDGQNVVVVRDFIRDDGQGWQGAQNATKKEERQAHRT